MPINDESGTGSPIPPGDLWTDWRYLADPIHQATALAIACHTDGRMHVISADLEGQLYRTEQQVVAPSVAWSSWHVLSNVGNKAYVGPRDAYQQNVLALACHPDGRMHAVMTGIDLQLWHNEQLTADLNAQWSDWHVLSEQGQLANGLALACHPDGRMHALMAQQLSFPTNDPTQMFQVWHNEQLTADVNAQWSDWHVLPEQGHLARILTLACHADGRMHAVIADPGWQLYHSEQLTADVNAAWTEWQPLSNLGNQASFGLALACHPDGRMHAVMAGMDEQLWHNEQLTADVNAQWSDWHLLSQEGQKATFLTLACHPDGRMHAVMAGANDVVWHNEQTAVGVGAAWSDWHYLSHPANKAKILGLACHPDDRMHAVMAGEDSIVWHNEQL